jgi:hypothetical protein
MTFCGGCGEEPKEGVVFKLCAGCGDEAYCCSACQSKAWADHKGLCKIKRKERAKSKEAAAAPQSSGSGSGPGDSGSGLRDMGSIMATLMKSPKHQPQPHLPRYNETNLFNNCLRGHPDELQKVLKQSGIDANWADPKSGSTAARACAQNGHAHCLSLLALHGGVDLSKADKAGFAPIHLLYMIPICPPALMNSTFTNH